MKRFIYIIIGCIVMLINLTAQNKTIISGIIKDENGKPIPYVNVFLLNTSDGTMSDDDGKFSFKTSIKGKTMLIASMVGYEKFSKEIEIISSKKINEEIVLRENAVRLNETIVTASSYGSEKEKGLVISRIDVLTTPGGATDIYQSLKTMPGVTQVSESAQLYVRGGDPIETITMINQSVVYHPFTYESAYGGLFSNLNQSAVKSIYFTSGGFSAKYGNALSGVLDIETKDQINQTNFGLGVSLANVNIASGISIIPEKLGLYFDAQQSFVKPIYWLNGGQDRMAVAPTSKNFSGGIVYKYSETGKLKLFTIIADDKQGVNVERAEYNGVFDGNTKNTFVNIQSTDVILGNIVFKNSAAYNKYSNSWKLGILDILKTDYVYSFRSDVELVLGSKAKLLAGAEIENRVVQYEGKIPVEDYDIRPDGYAKIIDAKFNGRRFGAFSEFQQAGFLGIENLSATAGVRYDNFVDLNVDWIDPRFGLGYKLNDKSIFRFGAGVFKQIPDPRLYSPVDGNPNLKPMQALHLIASYEYLVNDFNSFRVEVYTKEYKNLPLENDLLNYDNSGHGFANGIDIIYKGDFPFGINGWISYGFINTKRLWMDYDNKTSSDFDITHNISLVARYGLTENIQIGLTAKYATGRPFTPAVGSYYRSDINIYEPVYAQTNSSRFSDYKRIDLRLTYLNTFFEKYSFVGYVEGINIFDFNNIFGYSYSPDYGERNEIQSYFGQRMIVFGFSVGI